MGEFERPLWVRWGLPKATARVDSRLKLTIGKLVSSQLITCDKLTIVGVGLGLGLGLWRRADCSLNFSQKLASLGNYMLLNEEYTHSAQPEV